MKKILITIFSIVPLLAFSQGYKIRIGGGAGTEIDISNIPANITFNSEIKTIEIKKNTADNPAKTYTLNSDDQSLSFSTNGNYHSVTFSKDIREIGLSVNDDAGNIDGAPFVLHKKTNPPPPNPRAGSTIIMPMEKTATQYIVHNLFKGQIQDVEGIGLKLFRSTKNNKRTSEYMGTKYIHLFFDQNGNSLLHSIPIGIGRANYVVHVIYLIPENNPLNVDYKVNQSTADIEEGVVIRSDESLQNTSLQLQALDPDKKPIKLEWRHTETALTASNFDIKFDIVRSGFQINEGNLEINDPVVVTSKVIKVKKVYHGSIDVGVLKTNLENPTFTLTASDIDPTQMVVKKTNTGSRVLASAMYTFYLSPIVILEKIFTPSKVQNYKIEGRSFVDDHKIYERIYPTVGIGLSDRLLDNVFIGGKWEFVRGGSLFMGYHWGKVNVLNVDGSFEFEKTHITQAAFNLKTDTKFKGDFCVGLNLDIRIITNLYRTSGVNGQ